MVFPHLGQKGLKSVNVNKNDPIVLNEKKSPTKNPHRTRKWIDDLHLLQEDQQIILSHTAWINDRIIDACQCLLRQHVENDLGASGFQSVCLGEVMYFSVEQKQFIQILNTGHSHWVTISTIGTYPVVYVYDSMYDVASSHLRAQIACLLMAQQAEITITFVDVKKQIGSYDCGLYAIAYATALAHGCDPGGHHYYQEKLRSHLKKCLLNRRLSLFPHKLVHPSDSFQSVEKVAVYCLCRMPEIPGLDMIECTKCKEWYHLDVCVKVPTTSFKRNVDWLQATVRQIRL